MSVFSHPDGKIAVLITGAGGAGTIEIIQSLRAIGGYRIIAVDASEHAAGFALADSGYVIPLATSENFMAVVGDLIGKEQPDFAIPLVDEEILLFHRILSEYGTGKICVVAPTKEFCAAALDKWLTFIKLRDADILTPRTSLASHADDCVFPAVIKPRDGRGSRELAYLTAPDELASYLTRAPRKADCYIVQEHVAGQEYTVSVVVGLGGPTLAVVPKEVIVKRGITQVGVTRVLPEVDRLCCDIQDRLRADGPFNVQLIMSQDRTPYVIEINPRYSTTVALTIAAGINEVDVVIRHALGKPIEPLKFQPNLLMIRHYTQMYTSEATWPPANVIRCV